MNSKSKKLVMTQRGKVMLGVSVAILTILLFFVTSQIIDRNFHKNIPSDEVYSYSINNMITIASHNEQDARENLRNKINEVDELLKESQGKVFDSSYSDLATYVDNIREVPDSQVVESNNLVDYVKSENKINSFLTSLNDKQISLQESYSNWVEKREVLNDDQSELQQRIDEGTISVSELERLLKDKQVQGTNSQSDRERLLEELRKKNESSQNNQPPASPNPPPPTSDPSTPVPSDPPTEAPSPTSNPSPTPSTPPTPTSNPPTVSPTPTPTPKPTPTSPNENEDTEGNNQQNSEERE